MELLHGDCLELMKTLPDKSVDLFLCDLPYGCLTNNANATRKRFVNGKDTGTTITHQVIGGCAWDIPIDLAQFWTQVKRLCKNDHTPVLMFCSTKFGFELINSNPDWFRYDLVWSKPNAVGFLSANKMPMRSHEMIYVFSKKGANYTRIDVEGDHHNAQFIVADCPPHKTEAGRRCVKSVVDISNKKTKGGHPTQKPSELYEWLITRYSKEGDTVLDPTAGSFASVFTAHALGRKAIGIEKDKTFYDKAISR